MAKSAIPTAAHCAKDEYVIVIEVPGTSFMSDLNLMHKYEEESNIVGQVSAHQEKMKRKINAHIKAMAKADVDHLRRLILPAPSRAGD